MFIKVCFVGVTFAQTHSHLTGDATLQSDVPIKEQLKDLKPALAGVKWSQVADEAAFRSDNSETRK